MADLVDYVNRFRRARILVLGDVMLDSYLEGSADRLCTEGPVPVVQKTSVQRAPGGAANTAANLASLGASVRLLSIVGEDPTGDALLDCLSAADVDCSLVVRDSSASTIHKLRILADDQYVVRFDEGEARSWSTSALTAVESLLESTFDDCDALVVSDYAYGVLCNQVLHRVQALRRRSAKAMYVDAKDVRQYRNLAASVITPNHIEAHVAVERTIPRDLRPDAGWAETLARRLLTLIDAERVAITLAAQGVLLLDRSGAVSHIPAYPVAHANDVGAGDSFLAALSLAMTAGASFEEAARIGVEAARIAVTKRRTVAVEQQELLQAISLAQHHPTDERSLTSLLEGLRRQGKTIVFTNGVFDILHAGHVEFLRRARSLGDVLVVGINSDISASRLKGRNRPINSERDRMALIEALDAVDYALLFDEDEPSEVIRRLRPSIHAKGGDYAGESLPEAEAVREVGGEVVFVPLIGSLSTSSVIERIVELELEHRLHRVGQGVGA